MALTAAEQAELEMLEAKYGHLVPKKPAVPQYKGLTPAEAEELAQLELKYGKKEEPSITSKVLSGVGRALDYTSGLGRTALATAGEAVSGKKLLTAEEKDKALSGQAVPGEELLKRAGVPEMGSFEIPLAEKQITGRDVAGFAADVAADPLTYMTLGILPAARGVKAALAPAGRLTEKAGEKLFKSGLKNVDQKLIEKGGAPLSQTLMKEGVWGTNKGIQKETEKMISEAGAARDALLAQADELGAVADPAVAVSGAIKQVDRLKRDPGLADLGEKLSEKIKAYSDAGPQTLTQMSEWKTNLYNALPQTAFDKMGRITGPAKKVEKALSLGFKNEIEQGLERTAVGGGQALQEMNARLGNLLQARKPIAQEVKKATVKNVVTPVDAMLAVMTGAYSHSPVTTAAVVGAKKAADISKTTWARTGGGQFLRKTGQLGIPDILLRESLSRGFSPWPKVKDPYAR